MTTPDGIATMLTGGAECDWDATVETFECDLADGYTLAEAVERAKDEMENALGSVGWEE